jgi:hypothetical protein
MFFTRIGRIFAHLIFWASAFRIAVALIIATTAPDMEANAAFSRRYLGAATSGEALSNTTFLTLLAGVALGVLCEISARMIKRESSA